ncbi:MAG: LysM peptidoglycan-binding domain-containing protein [Phycisphaerae bacterium]
MHLVIAGLAFGLGPACGPAEPATTRPTVAQVARAKNRSADGNPRRSAARPRRDDFDFSRVPGRIHVVESKDNLWNLAERYYGNGKHWRRILIANRNRVTNSTELQVGMKLIIPEPPKKDRAPHGGPRRRARQTP